MKHRISKPLLAALVACAFGVPPAALAGDPPGEEDVRQAIGTLLEVQSEAWTRGDLETFTSIYADDCLYLSPTGPARGRAELLERYRRRYPDKAAMGRLTLEIVELDAISDGAEPGRVYGVSVVGRWKLSYAEDAEREDAEGWTLLVFKRFDGDWKIVHDASM